MEADMHVLNYNIGPYPHLGGNGRSVLMIVLTVGQVRDYACYGAIVDLPVFDPDNSNNYETAKKLASTAKKLASNLVAAEGVKLSYKEAIKHFPSLPEEAYRA